jgi:CDGSH-type Zn-finger protein
MTDTNNGNQKKIEIEWNGPYQVDGEIPLVRKIQVVSEFGEPIAWQTGETLKSRGHYELCRCGHSKDKPFCDSSHLEFDFDGTETASTQPDVENRVRLAGGKNIIVRQNDSLCADSGYCGLRNTNIAKLLAGSADTQVRLQVMAMVEHCPSGSYTYAVEEDGPEIEPDLPQQIAVVTEITADGPIAGPLWVTGGIPIKRSDDLPVEPRNRVTLCCCGESNNKPFCDGTHRAGH